MVLHDFRKAARFAEDSTHPMAKQTIITLDTVSVLLADVMFGLRKVLSKRSDKRIPIISCDTVVCNAEFF